MQTYQYRFPVSGQFKDKATRKSYAEELYHQLTDSPDCLDAYCAFPTRGAILHGVTMESDEQQNIRAVHLHTYMQVWEGSEQDFTDCVTENLNIVNESLGKGSTPLAINGELEDLGLEGEAPKILYQIMKKERLETVLQDGMTPRQGKNAYKQDEDRIHLCEAKDIAPWLSILKVDDPAIVEVDTEGLTGLKPGSTFKDRDYCPAGYSEYYTTEPIPVDAIKKTDLSLYIGDRIALDLVNQVNRAESVDEIQETVRGLRRGAGMGMISSNYAEDVINARQEALAKKQMPELPKETTPSLEAEDEGLPWAEEDDFTKAVASLSVESMNYGK